MTDRSPGPPLAALLLGLAGLLPFAALAIGPQPFVPAPALNETWLMDYAALILSFMGGAQWGLATAAPKPFAVRFAVSVVPALIGWVAVMTPQPTALVLLILSFTGLWLYDLSTVRQGLSPVWYGRLRGGLTLGVLICLVVARLRLGA